MREYELAVVLRTSPSETERKKCLSTIKEWLKGLKILKEEEGGQKKLSYPIKKEQSGFYYFLLFEGESSIPSDFEKRLLGQKDILRHLLIRRK